MLISAPAPAPDIRVNCLTAPELRFSIFCELKKERTAAGTTVLLVIKNTFYAHQGAELPTALMTSFCLKISVATL